MIETLHIKNLKCYQDATFQLKPLNVFTGGNSSGKSSIFQSLQLAYQASICATEFLPLDQGFSQSLGLGRDLLNSFSEESTIQVAFKKKQKEHKYQFIVKDPEKPFIELESRPTDSDIFNQGFYYLEAERIGPRSAYAVEPKPMHIQGIGPQGEYAAHALAAYEISQVDPALFHPDCHTKTLRHQVEYWMSEFVPPIEIKVDPLPETPLVHLSIRHKGIESEWLQPANAGFGISYTLPIVIAGMLSKKGSIIAVQNPEAHLHPKAQSRMGFFFALLAGAGRQVILETHSDHVLNGIRLATLQDKAKILPEDVLLYFLQPGMECANITTITLNEKAELSSWPHDFFDQAENDLAAISRARRNG